MDAITALFNEMGFAVEEERLPEAVLYSVARTFNVAARAMAHVYQRFGLTPASFNLLLLLKNGRQPETFTQHEVGQRLVVSPSNMTGLIDRMAAKGWVRRLPGRDRRSKILQITPKGAKLLDTVWPHHTAAVQQLPQALNAEETRTLVRLLTKFRHALEA